MARSNMAPSQRWFLLGLFCLMLCSAILSVPNAAGAQSAGAPAPPRTQAQPVTSDNAIAAPQTRDKERQPKSNIVPVPSAGDDQTDTWQESKSSKEKGFLSNVFGKRHAETEAQQGSGLSVGQIEEKPDTKYVLIVAALVLIAVAGYVIFFIIQFVRDRSDNAVDVQATKSGSRLAAAGQGNSASVSVSQRHNELIRENESLRAELDKAKRDIYQLRRQVNAIQGIGQAERGVAPSRAYLNQQASSDQEPASSHLFGTAATWERNVGRESQPTLQTQVFSRQPPSWVDVANIIAEASALNERDFRNRLAALGTLHAVGFNAGEIVVHEDETNLDRTANMIALRSASGGFAILPSREFIRSFTGVRQKIAWQPEDLSTIFDFLPDNGGAITYKSMPKVRPRNGDFGPIEIENLGSLGGFSA
jgi:hypothetical protein